MNSEKIKELLDKTNIKPTDEIEVLEYIRSLEEQLEEIDREKIEEYIEQEDMNELWGNL